MVWGGCAAAKPWTCTRIAIRWLEGPEIWEGAQSSQQQTGHGGVWSKMRPGVVGDKREHLLGVPPLDGEDMAENELGERRRVDAFPLGVQLGSNAAGACADKSNQHNAGWLLVTGTVAPCVLWPEAPYLL